MAGGAVLVFAVPGSPPAQPWSVVGGNVASALVGLVSRAELISVLHRLLLGDDGEAA
jgi:CBS domain-containing membrane protein